MLYPSIRLYYILGAIGLLGFLIAIVSNSAISLAIILSLDILLILIAIVDGIRSRRDRVKITRLPLYRLSIGRENPIKLEVKNNAKKTVRIKICDGYPVELNPNISDFTLDLASLGTEELSYTVFPRQRGEFSWNNIQVRQLSRWSLAWQEWKVAAAETAVVYPDLVGLRELSIRLTLEKTGTMRQARRLGRGTEFAELREYSQGDDTRMIDWKATARRSMPVVRVLEPEKEQTLIILLDRGRLMTAQVKGMKRFEWGLNATLSLALAGLNRGDRVGVGVFDRQVVTWIPPERGDQQMSTLLESLSRLQPVLLESDYLGVISQLLSQQTRRALVVLLTDWVDVTASTELLQTMLKLTPRYLPFCVALKDPNIDTIAHSNSLTIEGAYNQAIALDLLRERQNAAQILQKKGVRVLDAPANQITNQLVDRYLQLKDANRI